MSAANEGRTVECIVAPIEYQGILDAIVPGAGFVFIYERDDDGAWIVKRTAGERKEVARWNVRNCSSIRFE